MQKKLPTQEPGDGGASSPFEAGLIDQRISDLLQDHRLRRFAVLPQDCGQNHERGVDEIEEWREWSHQPPTPDQLRIENMLEVALGPNDTLLHIGVGGSDLARRFAPRVREIVGMTISQEEERVGKSLASADYRVLLWNKYKYWPEMPRRFAAIVDNNPTTFACCLRHVLEMFAWYADSLAPEGAIFTDRVGLGWVATDGDRGWSFDSSALAELVSVFDLRVIDLDGSVFGVTRPEGVIRLVKLRRSARVRRLKRGVLRPRAGLRFLGKQLSPRGRRGNVGRRSE